MAARLRQIRRTGRTRRRGARRRLVRGAGGRVGAARHALKGFRHATVLALALTGLLLTALGEEAEALESQAALAQAAEAAPPEGAGGALLPQRPIRDAEEVVRATGEEARGTARGARDWFVGSLPRLLVAIAALAAAWLAFRATRWILRRLVPGWSRANALTAVVGFSVWVVAGGVAISVIAGDIRGMLGSVGLVGLALSWALQTPIESATGWLLNSFRGYYRVGDRIAVGDIQGDVYRIDVLTTTLWEIGGAQPGTPVNAEQPTGRLITVPNNELLTGAVVNFTRDFPWVWDEVGVQVANESDLGLAAKTALAAVQEAIGATMQQPALEYAKVLRAHGIEGKVGSSPEVFLAPGEDWTLVAVRYLVPARERRVWKSDLTLRLSEAFRAPEVAAKVYPGYRRVQWQPPGDGRGPGA